ncbi:MAG: MFS transporter [Chloroflexi bacterium]|nr:MFS transporter [Chloroflexota bacterium]
MATTAEPEREPQRQRFFYGWVIVATMFAINFSTMATGTLNYGLFVLPMQNELALSRATFGWMQTTRRLSAGVLSFAVGWMIDRYGSRVYIPVAAVMIGGCLILVGMSSHAWQFILLFGLVGVSGLAAPNGLVTSVPVAKWFVRKRGRALAFATAGLGISGIVFLPVTQWLIDGYGWRSAWQILAVMFMVISIPAAALFLRRQPEDMGLRVDGDPPDAHEADQSGAGSQRQTTEEQVWTVRQAFRTTTMWKLIAVFALAGVAQGGASFHRIPYFVEKGHDPLLVSWSFAADAGGAAALALVAGWLADRIPIRFLAAVSFSGFIVAILLMIYVTSAAMMFLSTIVFGCSVGVGMIVHTYIFAEYYGRTFLGTIRGIVMPINLLSAGLGAPLVGYLHDYAGSYLPAWWTLLVIYGSCSALMLTALPPRRRDGAAHVAD